MVAHVEELTKLISRMAFIAGAKAPARASMSMRLRMSMIGLRIGRTVHFMV